MSYANESEVLEGILIKLRKRRSKLQDNLKEIRMELSTYPGTALMESCEKLMQKETLTEWQIEEVSMKINLFEKRKNGNASMDTFLDK